MQDLAVSLSFDPGRVTVRLSGILDVWHVPVLVDALHEVSELEVREILVDASGLTFVDAPARRYLARIALLAPLDHVDIRVQGLPASIRRRFEESGLSRILDVR